MTDRIFTREQVLGSRKHPEQLAELLADVMNGGCNVKEFAGGLLRQHRTLQQQVFALMLGTIYEWAEYWKAECYDLRNEFTCKTSYQIVKMLEEEFGEDFEVKPALI